MATPSLACSFPLKSSFISYILTSLGNNGVCPIYLILLHRRKPCKAGCLSQLPCKNNIMPKFSSETWDHLILSFIPVILGHPALSHGTYQNKIVSCICILSHCWCVSQIFPLCPVELNLICRLIDLQCYSENTLHAFSALFEMGYSRRHCFPDSLYREKLLLLIDLIITLWWWYY